MSAVVTRGHGGDGGGYDLPHPFLRQIGLGCRGVGAKKPPEEVPRMEKGRGEFRMHFPSWYDIKDTKKAHIRGRLMMESNMSHQYPSLISIFYDLRTHEGVWVQEESRLQYDEMIKLRDLGTNTPIVVPYTEEHILVMVIKGKVTFPREIETDDMLIEKDHARVAANAQAKAKKRELEELRSVLKSDPPMAELLSQLGSRSEIGLGSRAGGGDDDDEGH
nr:hypothetical protein [Tanacetum cinerariifolium]